MIGCQHDPERLLKGLRRIGQDLGDTRERFLLFRVKDVKNDTDQERMTGLFPMGSAFERPFGVDQNVGDVLHIADFGRPFAHLEQRIVAGALRIRGIEQEAMRERSMMGLFQRG